MIKKECSSVEELWNNMCPEERACNERLRYLSEKTLLANWTDLNKYIQGHIIILLSGEVKQNN